jgi:uncharacterized membrane protein YccC
MILEPTIAAIGMLVFILAGLVLQDQWRERSSARSFTVLLLWVAAIYFVIRFVNWAVPFFVS